MRHVLQPVVDLSRTNPSVYGFEGLARFEDGRPPDKHWQHAMARNAMERHHRFLERIEIRSWVGAVQSAQNRDVGGTLFINMIPSSIGDPVCHKVLNALKKRTEQRGFRLVPELTENGRADQELLLHAAAKLRKLGFRVSLDDCTEGSTSLSALLHMKPDFCKIDMRFIKRSKSLARELIKEVREWGGQIVVERVETAEQMNLALEIGATHGQGYLWGHPEWFVPCGLDGGRGLVGSCLV